MGGAQTTSATGCSGSWPPYSWSSSGRSLATPASSSRESKPTPELLENTTVTIQNILGDVLSCAVGYILGTVFLAIELWWLSIIWIVVSEVVCILYMRDSLVLAILTTLVPVQRLRQWQCAKIPKADSKFFFSRPCWWSARPKSC